MTSSTTFSEKSILYVEDEIIVAIEISEVLKDMGFGEVLLAHNLRAVETHLNGRKVDFALLDVNLGNGERTTGLGLRLHAEGTRVIFASGYNKSELSEELQKFEFLEKPISIRELHAVFSRETPPKAAAE